MATTIVLARHGETDWNRANRFQGHADVPLNDAGRAQAVELASRLEGEPLTHVYTSPLRRAVETAEIVAARLALVVEAHPALMEVDLGSWTGLPEHEVEARYPEAYARWQRMRCGGWEDGESYDALAARVVAGVREIAQRHPGEQVLAVTHGGPIRSLRAVALRIPVDEIHARMGALANGATYRIAVQDGKLESAD